MPFKINIATKDGKTWKLESDSESLVGKSLGEKISGNEISSKLAGYELQIAGASDIAGFPHKEDEEGPQLRGVLLTKGWGMHKRPRKEGKKKVGTPKGFRKRKTVRGKIISDKTVQINLTIEKLGNKKLEEIFPEQNKKEEPEKTIENTESKAENEQETSGKKEEIKKEVKEEIKADIPKAPEIKTEEAKEKVVEEITNEVVEESKEAIEKVAEKEA